MGVTIRCKKNGNSIDLGYSGFARLRNKVAQLVGGEYAEHYALLLDPSVQNLSGKERKEFFEKYDKKTVDLLNEKKVNIKVVDFLLQSDAEGKIRYGACKEILKVIGDYDDNICYGYVGRDNCAMFRDFKALLQDCVEHKCFLSWS